MGECEEDTLTPGEPLALETVMLGSLTPQGFPIPLRKLPRSSARCGGSKQLQKIVQPLYSGAKVIWVSTLTPPFLIVHPETGHFDLMKWEEVDTYEQIYCEI